MKKILVGLTVLALVLMASPVLAVGCPGPFCGGGSNGGDLDIDIDNDDTHITNNIYAKSDTGDNEIETGSGFIKTGDAFAGVGLTNYVNYSDVFVKAPCNCLDDLEIDVENDDTYLTNNVTAKADTGDNEIEGKKHGGPRPCGPSSAGGKIITGDATTEVVAVNDVNSTTITVILKGISRRR